MPFENNSELCGFFGHEISEFREWHYVANVFQGGFCSVSCKFGVGKSLCSNAFRV